MPVLHFLLKGTSPAETDFTDPTVTSVEVQEVADLSMLVKRQNYRHASSRSQSFVLKGIVFSRIVDCALRKKRQRMLLGMHTNGRLKSQVLGHW